MRVGVSHLTHFRLLLSAGSGSLRTSTVRGCRMPEQFQLRGGFDQSLLHALRLLCLDRGDLAKPGYLLLQG